MANPVYFYSKTGEFAELSNFAPHGFYVDGKLWPTVEHYFQAAKFSDDAHRERIRTAASPKHAKELGQSRKLPIRKDWDDARDGVMLEALRLKFASGKAREVLLSTRDRELVEASPYDYYWGCGGEGSGLNRLGKLLMQVRDELRSR